MRLITRLNVGGPARHVVWLAAAMNDGSRFQTMLVTGVVPPGEDDMSAFAAGQGVTPVVVSEMSREVSWRDALTVWKVYRLMQQFRPDLVHTHTAKAGMAGRVAGWLYRWLTPAALIGRPRKVRFIHTYHGHIFHSYYGRLKTGVFLTIERILARCVTDRIVVLSDQQLHEIRDVFRVGRPAQFVVVPLGLDLEDVKAKPASGTRLRGELGVSEGTTLVSIAGRLTAIKNHELFLRVATDFPSGLLFAIFGDGSDRSALEKRVSELGITDRVLFAGTRAPSEIFAASNVVTLTSLNEGTPLALIEAMVNGLPIVSTAVGGVVDVLGSVRQNKDGYEVRERGLTVPSGNATAFSAALRRVLEDQPLREELGRSGKEYAGTNYSKERLVADIIALSGQLVPEMPGSNSR